MALKMTAIEASGPDDVHLQVCGTQADIALWFVHGFADCGVSFGRLFETDLDKTARLIAPDLPGFGASPRGNHGGLIVDHAATLLSLINSETPNSKIGLVGHSLGSAIAAEVAGKLGLRCTGVFSIEGNLTLDDAYFSGSAADFKNAKDFKNVFSHKIEECGAQSEIFRLYHGNLMHADADAMWRLGCDAKAYSKDDHPGHVLLSLKCPVHYFWCPENIPASTQKFLSEHNLSSTKAEGLSHWPMLDATHQVAQSLKNFFEMT
jgi:pimeloyl-ACP methyl ester carboxylesterase